MEEIILGLVIGLIVGTIAVYFIMKSRFQSHASKVEAQYQISLQEQIDLARKDTSDKQRSTIKGKIGEQMAPLLPEFTSKYEPADARFIGTPIDYVIFKNMHTWPNGERLPIDVVLLDIKTGKSNTSPLQNSIKDAIQNNRMSFDVIKPDFEDQSNS